MSLLNPDELAKLFPAESHAWAGPIPTQIVSSDEFVPAPQTRAQREVEARLKDLGSMLGRRHGLTRRRFLQTASGMAAAFLVMNDVYGALYDVSRAEADDCDVATERASTLKDRSEWRAALRTDRLAVAKARYEASGPTPSHLRYGYIARG